MKPTPAAPREWWIELTEFQPMIGDENGNLISNGDPYFDVSVNTRMNLIKDVAIPNSVHVIEKSAEITENEKRNEAVVLCSKMEAERNALKSELCNSREAFGIIEERLIAVKAEREELRAKCEELEAKFKDTQDDWKRIQDAERALEIERQTNARLRSALKRLRGEVKGILYAHETAIRYDSGNTNRECLTLAVAKADEALSEEGEG